MAAPAKPTLAPPHPAPSAEDLWTRIGKLSKDIDAQKLVAERAREGAVAAQKLATDAAAMLATMQADARTALAEYQKAIGAK